MTTNDKIVALLKACHGTDCGNCPLYPEKDCEQAEFYSMTNEQIDNCFNKYFGLDSKDEWQKVEPELDSVSLFDDSFDTVIAIKSSRKIDNIEIYFDTENENG